MEKEADNHSIADKVKAAFEDARSEEGQQKCPYCHDTIKDGEPTCYKRMSMPGISSRGVRVLHHLDCAEESSGRPSSLLLTTAAVASVACLVAFVYNYRWTFDLFNDTASKGEVFNHSVEDLVARGCIYALKGSGDYYDLELKIQHGTDHTYSFVKEYHLNNHFCILHPEVSGVPKVSVSELSESQLNDLRLMELHYRNNPHRLTDVYVLDEFAEKEFRTRVWKAVQESGKFGLRIGNHLLQGILETMVKEYHPGIEATYGPPKPQDVLEGS